MADLTLKLVITADGKAAVAGVESVGRSLGAIDKAAGAAAGSAGRMGRDVAEAGRAGAQGVGVAAAALADLRAREDAVAAAARPMGRSLAEALGQARPQAITAVDAAMAKLGSNSSRQWEALSRQGQAQLAVLKQTSAEVDKATVGFGALGRAAAGAFTAGAVLQFGAAMLDASRRADSIRRTLEAVTGSSRTAASEYAAVAKTADTLGINLNAAASSYAKLAASAKGTAIEGQATKAIFDSVVKAAAALGLSADETSGALTAIGQMMSKGAVASEELRGQLGERLPGAFSIASRAMGVSTQELGKMLEKGEVIASDFLPAFAAELDRTYSNARFDGINNNIARITNAWERFKASLADSVGLPAIINEAAGALDKYSNTIAVANLKDARRAGFAGLSVDQVREMRNSALALGDLEEANSDALQRFIRSRTDRMGSTANIGSGPAPTAMAANAGRNLDLLKQSREERARYERESAIADAREKKDVTELARLYKEKLLAMGKMTAGDAEAVASMQAAGEIQRRSRSGRSGGAAPAGIRNDPRQMLQADLEIERSGYRRSEDLLKQSFDARQLTAATYYQRLEALRRADLDAQISAGRMESSLTTDKGDRARLDARLIGLQQERATLADQTAIAIAKANEDEAQSVQRLIDKYDRAGVAIREGREDAARLFDALNAGQINAQQFETAVADINKGVEALRNRSGESTKKISEFGVQAARNMQSAFADFLFDPFESGIEGMAVGFANTVRRMLAEAASAQLLKTLLGESFSSTGEVGGLVGTMGKSLIGSFFAGGGMMTSAGPVALRKYASGGIADRPQLALFGEGSRPEAYVPLPDGRAIPVALKGPAGGGTTVNIIDMRGAGSPQVETTRQQGQDGREQITVIIREEIKKAISSGQMDKTMAANYGLRRSGVSR